MKVFLKMQNIHIIPFSPIKMQNPHLIYLFPYLTSTPTKIILLQKLSACNTHECDWIIHLVVKIVSQYFYYVSFVILFSWVILLSFSRRPATTRPIFQCIFTQPPGFHFMSPYYWLRRPALTSPYTLFI